MVKDGDLVHDVLQVSTSETGSAASDDLQIHTGFQDLITGVHLGVEGKVRAKPFTKAEKGVRGTVYVLLGY